MSSFALAQAFEGCPSKDILARFEEFGRIGKMPPDLGAWLGNPKAQNIEPWTAFDNVAYVGVCWVSAWAIRTNDGVVLIDTLHEPHVDQHIANLQKKGVNLSDIKYVLMTHGHFDHVGGAAKLKPLLPNARFVITQTRSRHDLIAGDVLQCHFSSRGGVAPCIRALIAVSYFKSVSLERDRDLLRPADRHCVWAEIIFFGIRLSDLGGHRDQDLASVCAAWLAIEAHTE